MLEMSDSLVNSEALRSTMAEQADLPGPEARSTRCTRSTPPLWALAAWGLQDA